MLNRIYKTAFRLNDTTSSTKVRCAFTLTEVLLAVLIVGIIAALVLPAVVTKYQNKVLESAFNREVHSLQDSIDSVTAVENKSSIDKTTLATNTVAYMKKYLRVSKFCGENGADCFGKSYSQYSGHEKKSYTPTYDGDCAILKNGTSVCLKYNGTSVDMLIDANGPKGPNVYGRDLRTYTHNLKGETGYNKSANGVIAVNQSPINGHDPDPDPEPDTPPAPDPCAGKTCGCGSLPKCTGEIKVTFTLGCNYDSNGYDCSFSASGTGLDKILKPYADMRFSETYCQSNGCVSTSSKNIYVGENPKCESYFVRDNEIGEEESLSCGFSSPPYNVYGKVAGKEKVLCILKNENSSCTFNGTYEL